MKNNPATSIHVPFVYVCHVERCWFNGGGISEFIFVFVHLL